MSYIEAYEGESPQGATDTMCKIYADDTIIFNLSDCIPALGTYTLQFYIKSNIATDIVVEASGLYQTIRTTNVWVKYIYTFTAQDLSDNSVTFNLPAGIYYLYHVKLESGEVASDYTANPNDVTTVVLNNATTENKLYRLSDKYTDKIGYSDGRWYIERNTELLTLDGTEDWWDDGEVFEYGITQRGDNEERLPALCDHFLYSTSYGAIDRFTVFNRKNKTYICIKPNTSIASTLDEFRAWLGSNPIKMLIPSKPTTVVLVNYIQSALNNIIANNNLNVYFTEDNIHNVRANVLVKPIVFGTVNSYMNTLINNMSDESIGFIYQITCTGEVLNPVIYHSESNEHIKINGRFKLNDVITINTLRGKKSITKAYNGIEVNIINKLDNTSRWLQLQSGHNHLIQSADEGADNMDSMIIYTNEYEGV